MHSPQSRESRQWQQWQDRHNRLHHFNVWHTAPSSNEASTTAPVTSADNNSNSTISHCPAPNIEDVRTQQPPGSEWFREAVK